MMCMLICVCIALVGGGLKNVFLGLQEAAASESSFLVILTESTVITNYYSMFIGFLRGVECTGA